MNRVIALLLISTISLSCQSKQDSTAESVTTEADKKYITGLGEQWEQEFRNEDAASLANLYTKDCVRMPDGGPTTIGKEALENAYKQEFSGIWDSEYEIDITVDQVIITGDHAFARGSTAMKIDTTESMGKWVATYRKQSDGSWKYFWNTYNSN
jgi:uncharacterized protein (TIGR02246 family)